jgi:enoyl-CoA hydratase
MPAPDPAEPLYQTLLFERRGPIAIVTLNRPEVLNALNHQMFTDLDDLFGELTLDSTLRAVLLTGAGPKAFAAGADIAELALTDAHTGETLALRGQRIFRAIETCGKPVVACVNGFALGGGCELALACTFRLAADSARLGQPEVKLGLIPGYGGTQRLPRLVGPSNALRLILTGDIIPAAEALRIGLVDQVHPAASLLDEALAFAEKLSAQAPLAVAASLEAVQQGADLSLHEALALEARIFGRLSDSADKQEGVAAFLAKRKPAWTGN